MIGLKRIAPIILLAGMILASCIGGTTMPAGSAGIAESSRKDLLRSAKTWMYQLQALNEDGAVDRLAKSPYDMLVLEPGHNFSEYPYDTAAMVKTLQKRSDDNRRLLLAYIDIGQAEDYRDYWEPDWRAPKPGRRGHPDFMVTVDPDGWSGNFPVAYWRPEWKRIWLGKNGIVAELARLGFDGVYLDWVEAYDDDYVRRAAKEDGVDPETEMIRFIEEIGEAGRAIIPDFLVVPQNAPFLIDEDPKRYVRAIDALAVEDTWFSGEGDGEWDDPAAGDIPNDSVDEWSTPGRLAQFQKYQRAGLPVFSVDYCLLKDNSVMVYKEARRAGLRPLVTRVSLSRMTDTPPW